MKIITLRNRPHRGYPRPSEWLHSKKLMAATPTPAIRRPLGKDVGHGGQPARSRKRHSISEMTKLMTWLRVMAEVSMPTAR